MNPRENLILVKGKPATLDVVSWEANPRTELIDIQFVSGKKFSYRRESVTWLKKPRMLNPADYAIYRNGRALYDIVELLEFADRDACYWHVISMMSPSVNTVFREVIS